MVAAESEAGAAATSLQEAAGGSMVESEGPDGNAAGAEFVPSEAEEDAANRLSACVVAAWGVP